MLVATVALGLLLSTGQGAFEQIDTYDVHLVVEDDGDLVVTERIAYDFGAERRRGIYRDVPTRLHYDERHDRVYPLTVRDVRSATAPDEWKVEPSGDNTRIRVGDPDVEISGAHTYELVYEVEGALNGFDDHIELYWNAIGHEWSVPITRASVSVELPVPVTQLACFAGPFGSSLPCQESAPVDGARFAHGPLPPGEGLTVVVGMPAGSLPAPLPILRERWTIDRAFSRTPGTLAATGALLAALLLVLVRFAWRTGRDRRAIGAPTEVAFGDVTLGDEIVPLLGAHDGPVEFVPPDGIRPAQVGLLVDERAQPLDVTATIIDFAVRGYLRIEEIPKKGWFGKPDWALHRLRDPDADLLEYERLLFDGLFEGRGSEVKLSELKTKFVKCLQSVQTALYDDAMARGWFRSRPDKARAYGVLRGLTVLAAGIGLTWVAALHTRWGLVPLPLLLAGLGLMATAPWMAARTPRGTGLVQRSHGFRRFIEESEADRARFAEEQHLFTEYLPYAVVFGATERWAQRFAGLDGSLPDQSSWYLGSHGFHASSFGDAMDGFATTATGTIASRPGGSGSGFGGGSSGGGGGGGGGGSW